MCASFNITLLLNIPILNLDYDICQFLYKAERLHFT